MSNIKKILELNRQGFSGRQIAASLRVSRNTVSKVLTAERNHPLTEEDLRLSTATELEQALFPEKSPKKRYRQPDFDRIHSELKKPGVTLELVWKEYCAECRRPNEKVYQYSRFCDLYRQYVGRKGYTMVLVHKPADEVMVDWAGTTMKLTDPETGRSKPAYIFVAVLPFSMYTFALACPDMTEASWIQAHVRMYNYFGGVPRLLICDNTKTAVIHNRKSEPAVLNRVYAEMARYYGAAVLPARVRRPQDKAAAEASVRLITEHVAAPLRNTIFLSLEEMNAAIAELLNDVNKAPFQKREGSRFSVFTEEEQACLSPLPSSEFRMPAWRTVTVQKNYHVVVNKSNYSVPYQYVGKKVDVRTDASSVSIFYDGEEIASHQRDDSVRYHTIHRHMPAGHRVYQEWNARRFLDWAKDLGPDVHEVVRRILCSYDVEEQAYKSLFALLNLPKRFPRARLQTVCSAVIASGRSISLTRITQDMKQMHEAAAAGKTSSDISHAMMRGHAYYATFESGENS